MNTTGFDTRVPGAGEPGKVTPEELQEWTAACTKLAHDDATNRLLRTRLDVENIRLCWWDGQSADERLHADDLGEEPLPFEGACDQRIRLVDELINDDVARLVLSALQAEMMVTGVGAEDGERAERVRQTLMWYIRERLGLKWFKALLLTAQYATGDCPGVAILRMQWEQRHELRMRTLTVQDLAQAWLQERIQLSGAGTDAEIMATLETATQEFQQALTEPGIEQDALVEMLQEFFPRITTQRARKAVRELSEGGTTEFPVRTLVKNGPVTYAQRLYEDVWIPDSTTDFDDCPMWFEPEWVTAAAARERIMTDGWNPTFVDALLGSEDESPGFESQPIFFRLQRNSENGVVVEEDGDRFRGKYQVVRVFFLATNSDGVPGRYYVTFRPDIDVAAHGRRMLTDAHGGWPGVMFQREVLTKYAVDSRGYAELAGGNQSMIKLYADMYGDSAQLAALPPYQISGNVRNELYVEPLAPMNVGPNGSVDFMRMPAAPRQTDNMVALQERMVARYFGKPHDGLPADAHVPKQQLNTLWWLGQVAEVMRKLRVLIGQYASDDELAQITDMRGDAVNVVREDLLTSSNVTLWFDPRQWDLNYVNMQASVVSKLANTLDADNAIHTTPIATSLLGRVVPGMAAGAIKPIQAAQADEVRKAIENLEKIRAGVMPAMVPDGRTPYALHLQVYQQMQTENPLVFADMAQDKQQLLQTYVQFLQQQAQQFGANREIGRLGVERPNAMEDPAT